MSLAASLKPLVPKRKGIFPGYWLVAAGGVMIAWGAGLQHYGFGVYVKELTNAFGWTRAQVSLAYSFARMEGGIEGPLGGIAIDKWGPRAINFVGFSLFGLGLCLMYYVNSLWLFYVVWILGALGSNLSMADTMDAAVANWFVKRRGLMIGIMRSAIAVVTPLILPMITWLFYIYGWRLSFLIFGGSVLTITIPLTYFFVKPKRPEYYGWLPDGKRVGEEVATDTEAAIKAGVDYAAETGEVEFTVRQAIKDKIWWICVLGLCLRGMVAPALIVHTIPMLIDRGLDPIVAAAAMGTMVFMTLPGRVIFGWLGDRARKTRLKYLVIGATLAEALGLFILIQATTMTWVWVFLIVNGFGQGAGFTIWIPLRGRYWGRKAYATIQGSMMPFAAIAGIIAPVYAGWVYDTTGSYIGAFRVLLICIIVAAVVMFFANPPKPPKKIGKITEVV